MKGISCVLNHISTGLLLFTCMTNNNAGYDCWRKNYCSSWHSITKAYCCFTECQVINGLWKLAKKYSLSYYLVTIISISKVCNSHQTMPWNFNTYYMCCKILLGVGWLTSVVDCSYSTCRLLIHISWIVYTDLVLSWILLSCSITLL